MKITHFVGKNYFAIKVLKEDLLLLLMILFGFSFLFFGLIFQYFILVFYLYFTERYILSRVESTRLVNSQIFYFYFFFYICKLDFNFFYYKDRL